MEMTEFAAPLPRPDFMIFGYNQGGKIRFFATRHLTAKLSSEYRRNEGASWVVEARMQNVLIADGASWSEVFELVALQWAKPLTMEAPQKLTEVWVRVLVPEDST